MNGRVDTIKSLLMRLNIILYTHECRPNLRCVSNKGCIVTLKVAKESLQDIFIVSTLPCTQQ